MSENQDNKLFSDKSPPRKSPVGIYDETILCAQCEKWFNKVDDYAASILINEFDDHFRKSWVDGKLVGFRSRPDRVDQELLLRFFIATLWRASVSTQQFFNRVSLGPYEEDARRTICNPTESISSIFSCILTGWTVRNEELAKSIMDPYRRRLENLNTYRFNLGQVHMNIKVDKRPFPNQLASLALCAHSDLFILGQDIERGYLSMLDSIVNRSYRNLNARQWGKKKFSCDINTH